LPRTTILVLTNLPDRESADLMARVLIETRLAACVSIGAVHDSLYHWRGETEMAREVPMSIKTCADLYPAVEAAIRARHPYELPEIVAVPFVHGLSQYLDWIAAETRPAAGDGEG
jgi:periplasmic divalent cation tolerance protein